MVNAHQEEEVALLRQLRKDPEKILADMYRRYKPIFLGYIRKFGGVHQDHLEVYHDALLAFYDIWLEGRYDADKASVSTLLCAIGRNKLLTRLGKQQIEAGWHTLSEFGDIPDDQETDEDVDPRISSVERALEQLGNGCREIITLFYYHRRNIHDIAVQLDYKNENVVKAHKSRCMKRLREILQSTET